MVRNFFNIFLSILLPLTIIFTIVATFYFHQEYAIEGAIKLGLIVGILVSIAISFILALFILLLRYIQIKRYHLKHHSTIEPTPYKTPQENNIDLHAPSKSIQTTSTTSEKQNKIIFLMLDYDTAYEIALYLIQIHKIGILKQINKKKGMIFLNFKSRPITIHISKLTRHTSKITINPTDISYELEQFIEYLKHKELAMFL